MSDLDLGEYRRYGRQMILPEIGKSGQLALKASSVLIVGAGGLGCPAIAYLAGAGIGTLGIIDGDTVSLSNCHRQILYSASATDKSKVHVAAAFVASLNPAVRVIPFAEHLTVDNVESVFRQFQVVLDCTDNQMTRYLISDACVLLNIPLVSGSALKTEGQLAIYHYRRGPCYRCIFPTPTPDGLIETCGDAGILGPVVGVIGVLQALETIKLITRETRDQKLPEEERNKFTCTLTLFSAFGDVPWRTIKLRKKAATCEACGPASTMTFDSLKTVQAQTNGDMVPGETSMIERLEAKDVPDYSGMILDVRNSTQYEITSLEGSINVPIDSISTYQIPNDTKNVLVVCRNGIDSAVAAQRLAQTYPDITFRDLRGGLASYAKINEDFPFC